MGIERNRVASGKKAAATMRSKNATYYPDIGSAGGKAVIAIKRAFSMVPGLAKRAAAARHESQGDFVKEYVVRAAEGNTYLGTYNTREAARAAQRIHRSDKGIQTKIVRYTYSSNRFKSGFIITDRDKAAELQRLSELGDIEIEDIR